MSMSFVSAAPRASSNSPEKADIASGDRDPDYADLQTFNPLFPRGSYFNESALIGPDNFVDLLTKRN